MNKPTNQSEFSTPQVTTGPLPASRKVYTHPKADPSLSVPRRMIDLHPSANEAPVAEICLAPRSADSYSASGDGAEPGEITALSRDANDNGSIERDARR